MVVHMEGPATTLLNRMEYQDEEIPSLDIVRATGTHKTFPYFCAYSLMTDFYVRNHLICNGIDSHQNPHQVSPYICKTYSGIFVSLLIPYSTSKAIQT